MTRPTDKQLTTLQLRHEHNSPQYEAVMWMLAELKYRSEREIVARSAALETANSWIEHADKRPRPKTARGPIQLQSRVLTHGDGYRVEMSYEATHFWATVCPTPRAAELTEVTTTILVGRDRTLPPLCVMSWLDQDGLDSPVTGFPQIDPEED